jgi:hypothetical protein
MKWLAVWRPGLVFLVLLTGAGMLQSLGAQDRPLAAAASSPDELVRRFLDGVASNDLDAVLELAITREEFDRYVWPELPASEPERNLPADFVWGMTNGRGQVKIRSSMAAIGGRQLGLEDFRFTGGVEEYETYRLHRNTLLHLRDEEGKLQVIRLFGSVLELDGQFKIFSFNHD